jgi:hypothetical protein
VIVSIGIAMLWVCVAEVIFAIDPFDTKPPPLFVGDLGRWCERLAQARTLRIVERAERRAVWAEVEASGPCRCIDACTPERDACHVRPSASVPGTVRLLDVDASGLSLSPEAVQRIKVAWDRPRPPPTPMPGPGRRMRC